MSKTSYAIKKMTDTLKIKKALKGKKKKSRHGQVYWETQIYNAQEAFAKKHKLEIYNMGAGVEAAGVETEVYSKTSKGGLTSRIDPKTKKVKHSLDYEDDDEEDIP
jgi:hypothetical protein